MLKQQISFVYQDKKGQVTRRSLIEYSIVRKDDKIFITGKDHLRNNAIRRFLRSHIMTNTKIDETKDPFDKCGGKYADNRDFVINEKTLITYCLVCEYDASQVLTLRCLSWI